MFQWILTKQFLEYLKKLDHQIQTRVKEKIRFLSKQENPLLYATKLKGYKDIFKFRLGDYRILFRLLQNTLVLLFVKHRKDVYEKL